jgi:hypothetical protein
VCGGRERERERERERCTHLDERFVANGNEKQHLPFAKTIALHQILEVDVLAVDITASTKVSDQPNEFQQV